MENVPERSGNESVCGQRGLRRTRDGGQGGGFATIVRGSDLSIIVTSHTAEDLEDYDHEEDLKVWERECQRRRGESEGWSKDLHR